ncbi:hypothetical protein CAOG_000583 [Capsaspora owczarzaki ATCC 30864]|uniref:ZZ-type domain-containing protein n=1 Tax=Capsaspora owczarzaki (strain ATCC 30864) TaxID=595528 RepID=A0A0D2X0G6_CAPO3|nr:hypothetical protein CAOG_000583 [Capsaspora owczarzaki ATCC 30864]
MQQRGRRRQEDQAASTPPLDDGDGSDDANDFVKPPPRPTVKRRAGSAAPPTSKRARRHEEDEQEDGGSADHTVLAYQPAAEQTSSQRGDATGTAEASAAQPAQVVIGLFRVKSEPVAEREDELPASPRAHVGTAETSVPSPAQAQDDGEMQARAVESATVDQATSSWMQLCAQDASAQGLGLAGDELDATRSQIKPMPSSSATAGGNGDAQPEQESATTIATTTTDASTHLEIAEAIRAEQAGQPPASEAESYSFATDHLLLRNNQDYLLLIRTMVALEAQRIRVLQDIDHLNELRQKAAVEPLGLLRALKLRSDSFERVDSPLAGPVTAEQLASDAAINAEAQDGWHFPDRQQVVALPDIDWLRYGLHDAPYQTSKGLLTSKQSSTARGNAMQKAKAPTLAKAAVMAQVASNRREPKSQASTPQADADLQRDADTTPALTPESSIHQTESDRDGAQRSELDGAAAPVTTTLSTAADIPPIAPSPAAASAAVITAPVIAASKLIFDPPPAVTNAILEAAAAAARAAAKRGLEETAEIARRMAEQRDEQSTTDAAEPDGGQISEGDWEDDGVLVMTRSRKSRDPQERARMLAEQEAEAAAEAERRRQDELARERAAEEEANNAALNPTFNLPWSMEEQALLDSLLVQYPLRPDASSGERYSVIESIMQTRSRQQIASRCQKYTLKLARLGRKLPGTVPLPSPVAEGLSEREILERAIQDAIEGGRIVYGQVPVPSRPRSKESKRAASTKSSVAAAASLPAAQEEAPEPVRPPTKVRKSRKQTTMFAAPRVMMNEQEDAPGPNTAPPGSDDEDGLDEDVKKSAEYQELLRLKRLKKEIAARKTAAVVHTGFVCDGCEMSPILGTRWNCADCSTEENQVDLCDACHNAGWTVHDATHVLLRVAVPETDFVKDADYAQLMAHGYSYLDAAHDANYDN